MELGAHHAVDHRGDLVAQVRDLGLGAPAFVFSTTNTDDHLGAIVELIAPKAASASSTTPPPSTRCRLSARAFRSTGS